MKNLFVLFSFFTFSGFVSIAQHCPYDMEGIIVVNIHAEGSDAIIQNLKITLIDSLDNPVLKQNWAYSKYLGDTLRIWQNPSKTTFKTTIDCNHPANPPRIRYPFAKDNYVLVCPIYFQVNKYKLVVEDIDGKKNGGCYATAYYQLRKDDLYSLCGTYNLQIYPDDEEDMTRKYVPIEIELKRK